MDQLGQPSQPAGKTSPPHAAVTDAAKEAIVTIATEAFRDSPAWAKAVIAIPTIGGILAVVAGIGFAVWSDEIQYAFWLVAMGLFVFILALIELPVLVWLMLKTRGWPEQQVQVFPEASEKRGRGVGEARWDRLVPRQPIPANELKLLRQELEDIRHAAFAWLSQRGRRIALSDVRANVFLPDTEATTKGYASELFMLEELRVGMEGHPDREIRFLPQQGLTGAVFVKQDRLFIQAPSLAREGTESGEEIYPLTKHQIDQIHPDLCWIVSFPLRIPKDAGGVLNVDGLRHELAEDELRLLMGELAVRVAGFADRLAGLPKTRVTIMLEDVHNG